MPAESKADEAGTDRERRALSRTARRRGALRGAALLAALAVGLPAWALQWPWTHHRVSPPAPVHVVSIALDPGSAVLVRPARIAQYWDRNTLLLDLTRLAGQGGATLTPIAANGWPVRLEFWVRPGAMADLEVVGAQRVVFAVPAQGPALLLKLDPGVYQADTPRITLRWSATADLPR